MSLTDETLRDLVVRLDRSAVVLRHGVDRHDLERLSVPDSRACREAERLCREASSAALANHCFRSYAWGVLLGTLEQIQWDAELLYAAAMLHDLGLTPKYDRGGCFESDGAAAAREILGAIGWSGPRQETVANAIYLHMHEVAAGDSPEARLLAYGTSADVSGGRSLEVREPERSMILELFPRQGFKREMVSLFEEQARRKPACVVHQYLKEGIAERIMAAPYES